MAGQRINIMELKQLIKLKKEGFSNRKIAALLNVSRNTVNEYLRFFTTHELNFLELSELEEQGLLELFPSSSEIEQYRYKTLSEQFVYFNQELKKPGCTLQALWISYLEKHPDGYQYSRFCFHFSNWQGKIKSSGKLTHKAGEKLFIDFTGKKLSYTQKETGEIKEVNVFVAVLPASGYTFFVATYTQSKEDVIEALKKCFNYMGGVPLAIVPDNLKAAVTKAHKYEPTINKTLKDFGLHYGCVIAPTRTYSPKDKALVEGAVKLIYQRVFYPLNQCTFFSLEELNKGLLVWNEQYNDYKFSQRPQSRREEFECVEKPLLQKLCAEPYIIRYHKTLTVQKMGYIYLSEDKHYYSVPYRYIFKKVTVQYSHLDVEVYAQRVRIAFHKRSSQPGQYSTIKEHVSEGHKAFTSWSPEFFKEEAAKIGNYTLDYITTLMEQQDYHGIAYKQAFGILQLQKQYESERIENACKRASSLNKRDYQTIETILKNKQEVDLFEAYEENHIPGHSNIRGAKAYF